MKSPHYPVAVYFPQVTIVPDARAARPSRRFSRGFLHERRGRRMRPAAPAWRPYQRCPVPYGPGSFRTSADCQPCQNTQETSLALSIDPIPFDMPIPNGMIRLEGTKCHATWPTSFVKQSSSPSSHRGRLLGAAALLSRSSAVSFAASVASTFQRPARSLTTLAFGGSSLSFLPGAIPNGMECNHDALHL